MSESAQYYLPDEPTAIGSRRQSRKPVCDVYLHHTADGGEIDIVEGQIALCDGLEPAVYLSLWGGNERDSGLPGDRRRQWWGNLSETDPARCYRSETQHLLRSLPATSGHRRRLEDAVKNDLAWLIDAQIARSIEVAVSIPRLNAVLIVVAIQINASEAARFEFSEEWKGGKAA